MQYLHLDPNFQPFGKSLQFQAFTFSGGEPHIKIEVDDLTEEKVMITCRIQSFNDLGLLLMAADALKRMGVKELDLCLPYFPAARQDRLMIPGEPLSVKVVADLINNVGFNEVCVVDPHSEVTPALLNNVKVVNNHNFVKRVFKQLGLKKEEVLLISPDGGAAKKIFKLAKSMDGLPVVEAGKIRDVKTGKLKDFRVYEEDLKGKTCVVVDDICDGGGTFMGLAQALKEKNAGDLILIVTHGLFSRGTDELVKHYTKMYCSNTFSTLALEGLEQLEIFE